MKIKKFPKLVDPVFMSQTDDRDVIVQILRLREYCQKTDEPLFEWVSENIVAAIEGEAFRLTLTEMIMTARIDSSAKLIDTVMQLLFAELFTLGFRA